MLKRDLPNNAGEVLGPLRAKAQRNGLMVFFSPPWCCFCGVLRVFKYVARRARGHLLPPGWGRILVRPEFVSPWC